ncbi:hypothetical protein ACFL6F_04150, partial [Planctomycetota bacterium]
EWEITVTSAWIYVIPIFGSFLGIYHLFNCRAIKFTIKTIEQTYTYTCLPVEFKGHREKIQKIKDILKQAKPELLEVEG